MKADNGNQQFWGRWSGSYDGFMGSNSSLYEEMALRMKRRLSRQMCVLELACGTGLISQRLAGSVKSLEATDYAPEMIAEARKKVHSVRLHFSVQNATCLPYAPGSFDAVVIANGLHVIPDPEKVLSEAHRVLKSGGLLLAPTFVHGQGFGFRLRTKLLKASRASDLSQVGCPGVCGFRIPTGLLCYGAGYHGKQNCPTMLPGGAAKEHDIKRLKGSTA